MNKGPIAVVLLAYCALAWTSPLSRCRAQETVIVRALSHCDEALTFLRTMGRGNEGAEALAQSLRRIQFLKEDISPEVLIIIKGRFSQLPRKVLKDGDFWRCLSKDPNAIEDALKVADHFPVEHLGQRMEALLAQSPRSSREILHALAEEMPHEDAALFLRGVGGRELSNRQVQACVNAIRDSTDSQVAGDAFEVLCRKQISSGTMKSKVALRKGTEILDGRHNGVHGLDGIGVAEDGIAYVFEFSINKGKNLKETGQLSPKYVADRWNKLLEAQPEMVERLRAMGIRDEFLKPINVTQAAGMHRKYVALSVDGLAGLHREAVELGMNDLMVLGK